MKLMLPSAIVALTLSSPTAILATDAKCDTSNDGNVDNLPVSAIRALPTEAQGYLVLEKDFSHYILDGVKAIKVPDACVTKS